MVLIPSDAALRMRLQAEALVHPVAPVTEILGDLPELRQGQQFTARIVEALPQGTYKALVADKEITLSLSEGARVGDTLELVVVDRSSKSLFAQLAAQPDASETANEPYPFANLSRTARLIGTLLPNEGETAPPAPLNAGKPVLDAPPVSAASLAAALKGAVRSSGVFYEAHQAQWVTGRFPLAQLLEEPQAQHSDFARLVSHLMQSSGTSGASISPNSLPSGAIPAESAAPRAAHAITAESVENSGKSALTGRRYDLADAMPPGAPRGREADAVMVAGADASESLAPTAQHVPDDVRPLVQQQLDALATDRLVWQGEAWPRQVVEWQIEREPHDAGSAGDDDDSRWNTTLALTTPSLGRIDAKLQLSRAGVRIVIAADAADSVAMLRAGQGRLGNALDAAGVPLLGMLIMSGDDTLGSPREEP